MDEIRTFIAIEIPLEIRTAIDELQEILKQDRSDVKWVKSQNIHVTLKFLGNIMRSQVEVIADALERIANDFTSFSVYVKSIGTFPNINRPRVIWVGAETDNNELIRLAGAVNEALAPIGFEKGERPFKAHLTLGRVKGMKGVERVMERFAKNRDFDAGNFTASSVIVMQSELMPTGAVYTPLRNIELK